MQKILITGGAGFIGSSLAEALLADTNNFVVLVDNLLTGCETNIPEHENCVFIKCDVNRSADIMPVMKQYQFDQVFHYAAVVGVNRAIRQLDTGKMNAVLKKVPVELKEGLRYILQARKQ